MEDQQTGAAGMIVVGLDGSEHAAAALRFALAEGVRRGSPVRVVTAYELPSTWAFADGLYPYDEDDEVLEAVREETRLAVDAIRGGLDDARRAVPVEVVVGLGAPSAVLPERARGAALLVVGHRGRGGLRSALLGSVGLAAVMHATCPVTVVPADSSAETVPVQESTGVGAGR